MQGASSDNGCVTSYTYDTEGTAVVTLTVGDASRSMAVRVRPNSSLPDARNIINVVSDDGMTLQVVDDSASNSCDGSDGLFAHVLWGDGKTTVKAITEGDVVDSHTYDVAGTYTISYAVKNVEGRKSVALRKTLMVPSQDNSVCDVEGDITGVAVNYGTMVRLKEGLSVVKIGHTDAKGHYVIPDVQAGRVYTLEPSRGGYGFIETVAGYSTDFNLDCGNNATGHDFMATTMMLSSAEITVQAAGFQYGGGFVKTSHHVNNTDGTVESADCLVCHDLSKHTQGTVRLKDADTEAVYSFESQNPASVEDFCLSCHDSDGAGGDMSPFSDGKMMGTAPYRASSDIANDWQKSFGHGMLEGGERLTCLGDGTPGTGCHISGHGSDNVGLLARNLLLPYPLDSAPFSTSDEGNYELCLSCHANYPGVRKEDILGVKQGSNYDWDHWWGLNPPYYIESIQTMFRDRQDQLWGGHDNLHYFHLEDENWWAYWGWGEYGGWRYRDSIPSTVHCLSCHSVHGSDTEWGWVYDELQYYHYSDASGLHGKIGGSLSAMSSYPVNCVSSCHEYAGSTDAWIEPSDE